MPNINTPNNPQITESYAFLPRDAVTKFLSGCHICKKTARPFSPSRLDDTCTESSSELDALHNLSVPSTDSSTPIADHTILDNIISTEKHTKVEKSIVDWEEAISLETINPKVNESTDSEVSMPVISVNQNLFPSGTSQTNSTYYEQIYTKINEYYSYHINNNSDMKDLAASNDLMNYYQMLRTVYEQSFVNSQKDGTSVQQSDLPNQKVDNISSGFHSSYKNTVARLDEPIIDLTISKASSIDDSPQTSYQSNININIENSIDAENTALKISPQPENNITISSAGVSINVSNSSRELTISCKTTPPKKRYSVFSCGDSGDTIDNTKVNLSAKFNVESCVVDSVNAVQCTDSLGGPNIQQQLIKYRQSLLNSSSGVTSTCNDPVIEENGNVKRNAADCRPITSTYLQLMRSMGLSDEDALKFDNLVSRFLFYFLNILFLFLYIF